VDALQLDNTRASAALFPDREHIGVRVVPYQPHSLAFGGFDLQMLAAMDAVRAHGVDVQPLDLWSRDARFEVVHLWGLGPVHSATATWARRSGKAIVMTALLPYRSRRAELLQRLRARFGIHALDRQLAQAVDVLVVVNEENAETARRSLGLPASRVAIVPHLVDEAYFSPPHSARGLDVGLQDFVLCVGNVSPRKNQVGLARAARAAKLPLLLIGDVLPGDERYGVELRRVVETTDHLRWLPALAAGSDDLRSAYAQCVAFALPSFEETQPISALEAVAMGKGLLLGDRPYAAQRLFRGARLVDPRSPDEIARGLKALVAVPSEFRPSAEPLATCRTAHVGAAYATIYRRALVLGAERRG
jgi:glycosyltransferase involved in cell wall biosynthesis